MYYAVFHPETKVVLAIDETEFHMSGNDRVLIPKNDTSIIGKRFIGTIDEKEHSLDEFHKPKTQTLTISLDKDLVTQGDQVTATAEVKDQDGDLVDISGTYFVPIIRNADKWQAKLLEVNISNGQVTVPFSINEPGIYTISMQHIYPTPRSKLAESPILIVKEKIQ